MESAIRSAATALPRDARRWLAVVSSGIGVAFVLLLAIRRAAGALVQPLPAAGLAILGVSLAAWAHATKRLPPDALFPRARRHRECGSQQAKPSALCGVLRIAGCEWPIALAILAGCGIAADDLRILIVRDTARGEDHAVVAARLDGSWLTLDNRRMATA